MTVGPRTYAEEQQAVTTAVINVLHSLTEIAADNDLPIESRIEAAVAVLAYAADTDAPASEESEEEETPVSEGTEKEE